MLTSGTSSNGYRAALINGRWQIQPAKISPSPFDQILLDIERALIAKFYYLAIMMTLALPDICACLESPNGNTRGRGDAYKQWFRKHLSQKFRNLTDVDAYQLRCGVIHQGHFGDHPRRNYDRIIFVGRNPSVKFVGDAVATINPDVSFNGISVDQLRLSGRILHLEAEFFWETVIEAAVSGRSQKPPILTYKPICQTLCDIDLMACLPIS
jgi:hypothetical protein